MVSKMFSKSESNRNQSDGIGEALMRSASSMNAAGNTLEETVGLVTAALLVGWVCGNTYQRTHLIAGMS